MAVPNARCPGCNAKLASKTGFAAGKQIRCPKCGTRFAVPEPALAAVATAPAVPKPAPPAPVGLLSLDEEPPPPARSKGFFRLALACVVVLTIGAGGFLLYERKHRDAGATHASVEPAAEQFKPKEEPPPPPPPEDLDRPIDAPDAPPFPGVFPRRLLFVSVTKYALLNPLTAGPLAGPDRSLASALTLATNWKVPTDKKYDQLYVLSDSAPPPDGRTASKDVVRGTVERFLATSRAQDHVALYFGGHAFEIGGKAYFAPADGEHDDPATLIPVDEIYAHLRACKAAQKVVIWDVCRLNPQRGRLRPGSEPMSPGLAAAISAAPPDTEVLLTCQPSENAGEVYSAPGDGGTYSGSTFLEGVRLAGEKPTRPRRNPQPTDPIMTAAWASVATKRLADLGGTQTAKVAGAPRATAFPFDAAEPPPVRFAIPEPAKKSRPAAPSAEVTALIAEFAVPPLKTFGVDTPPPEFPDRPGAIKDYKADVPIDDVLKNRTKYPFRAAVLDALGDVRSLWKVVPKGGGLRIRESFTGDVSNTLKRDIKSDQNTLAVGIAALEAHNDRLDALQKDRAAQPKRWQAHFDYARAVVKSRLAYLNEYNLMLGNVLTETLPARDAKLGQDGYRLASADTAKMKSKKDVKQLAAEAAELFDRIAAERKGTPWGDHARRDRLVPYGMAWQALASKP